MTALLGAQATTSRGAVLDVPSDDDIRRMLAERVTCLGKGVGIIVGVIEPGARRVISYGQLSGTDPRAPQGDTVFEIGSVTKVFTALLLADMVERREVALRDPITKYLPAGTKLPERNGQPVTLLDVATHTSGLPLLPGKQLASEAQMAERGTRMAGPGTGKPFRDVDRIVATYGGRSDDWVKVSSGSYTAKDGARFETHWVENLRTGQRVEFKTKLLN